MSKVYLVIRDSSYECDASVEVLAAYDTEEKALKHLNSLWERENKEYDETEFVQEKEADHGDMVCRKQDKGFLIWAWGAADMDHTYCYIEEVEVK